MSEKELCFTAAELKAASERIVADMFGPNGQPQSPAVGRSSIVGEQPVDPSAAEPNPPHPDLGVEGTLLALREGLRELEANWRDEAGEACEAFAMRTDDHLFCRTCGHDLTCHSYRRRADDLDALLTRLDRVRIEEQADPRVGSQN